MESYDPQMQRFMVSVVRWIVAEGMGFWWVVWNMFGWLNHVKSCYIMKWLVKSPYIGNVITPSDFHIFGNVIIPTDELIFFRRG